MNQRGRSPRSARPRPLELLESRSLLTMVAAVQLPAIETSVGISVPEVDLSSYFKEAHPTTDYAIFNTSAGAIPVLLNQDTAPKAVASFLDHVNQKDYNDTIVDRSVPGSSWQAGTDQLAANSSINPIPATAAVPAEVGAPATRGTVAMPTTGSSGQFLFNETDNSATQPAGESTVFGRVVGSNGLAVMDAIGAVPVPSGSPLAAPLDQAPLQHYTPGQPLQAYNFTLVNSVTTANAYYEISTDAPAVVDVSLDSGQLKVLPLSAGTANVAVVAYGSDGTPVAETFQVTVDGDPEAPPAPVPTIATVLPPTAALTTPVPVASLFTPTVTGSLPVSIVAGQKVKIQQTVNLSGPPIAVKQAEHVTLSLSADGSKPSYTLAATSTNLNIKAGKSSRINLATGHIGAAVPAGPYHLLVTVADADGPSTTIDTGKTVIVAAPQARSARR